MTANHETEAHAGSAAEWTNFRLYGRNRCRALRKICVIRCGRDAWDAVPGDNLHSDVHHYQQGA